MATQNIWPLSDVCNGQAAPPYITGDPDGDGDSGAGLEYYGPNPDDVLTSTGASLAAGMNQSSTYPSTPSLSKYVECAITDSCGDDMAWEVACDISGVTLTNITQITIAAFIDFTACVNAWTLWGNGAVGGSLTGAWQDLCDQSTAFPGGGGPQNWVQVTVYSGAAINITGGVHLLLDLQQLGTGPDTTTDVKVFAALMQLTGTSGGGGGGVDSLWVPSNQIIAPPDWPRVDYIPG